MLLSHGWRGDGVPQWAARFKSFKQPARKKSIPLWVVIITGAFARTNSRAVALDLGQATASPVNAARPGGWTTANPRRGTQPPKEARSVRGIN
jgi:hypothetical protein